MSRSSSDGRAGKLRCILSQQRAGGCHGRQNYPPRDVYVLLPKDCDWSPYRVEGTCRLNYLRILTWKEYPGFSRWVHYEWVQSSMSPGLFCQSARWRCTQWTLPPIPKQGRSRDDSHTAAALPSRGHSGATAQFQTFPLEPKKMHRCIFLPPDKVSPDDFQGLGKLDSPLAFHAPIHVQHYFISHFI